MPTFIDIDPSFTRDARTGDVLASEDLRSVQNSIVGLVLTAFESRPFEPKFDSPASVMEFMQVGNADTLTPYMIENIIGQVISNHEPRANFIGTEVNRESPNQIRINVRYQLIEDPEQEQNLEITV